MGRRFPPNFLHESWKAICIRIASLNNRRYQGWHETTIIIPARYASSRFPGKPLAFVRRLSILRTLQRGVADNADIYVATDDDRIADAVQADGGQTVMTSDQARNGTERVAEAATILGLDDDEVVINLQGDAPLTPSWFIQAVTNAIAKTPGSTMVTPVLRCDLESYRRFKNDRAHGRVGATTAVLSNSGRAIYFSRKSSPTLKAKALSVTPVYHHVGLYAYRVSALKQYAHWGVHAIGPLEQVEGLEQLRFIENDCPIDAIVVEDQGHQFWELNNPEDVAIIEEMIQANSALGTASAYALMSGGAGCQVK